MILSTDCVRPLGLCVLATLLCSCAATSVKRTWKSPEFQQPPAKIAIITIDDRSLLRQGFENRFSHQLGKAGTSAMVTYDQLSLTEIKEDKQAAANHFRAGGADAVLIMRLVDTGTGYREIQPGHDRYAAVTTGVESYGWYTYYSVGFASMTPTYASLKRSFLLETILFDLKTEKRLWSAISQTVITENMEGVAEMDPLVAKLVAAMRKDGVLR